MPHALALDALRRSGRTLVPLAVLLAALFGLGGCNTVSGAGEDLSAAGRAVTGTSEEVEDDL